MTRTARVPVQPESLSVTARVPVPVCLLVLSLLPRKPARFGRRSSPPVNIPQLMRLAGGLGMAASLSTADSYTDPLGPDWEVPSARSGGERRRAENKHKAADSRARPAWPAGEPLGGCRREPRSGPRATDARRPIILEDNILLY